MEYISAIQLYIEAGGDVLWLIALATFCMWALIFERIWYINFDHRKAMIAALETWESRPERNSWHAHMIRSKIISEVNEKLKANTLLIKTFLMLLPLLGLLGTVTGMVQVFEAMAFSGGNARSMAAGVSAATIPTMSGMVASLSGILADTWVSARVNSQSHHLEDTLTTDH